LIIATVVFRCDVLILLGTTALWVWLVDAENYDIRQLFISGCRLFVWGLLWLLLSLMVSVPLDTHMWDRDGFFWPEGVVLFYNTILNKSSNWGTSPFYWYFTSALPRSLLIGFLLVPVGTWFGRTSKGLQRVVFPSIGFVLLYSILPHKEVRFLFPVLPGLTFAAAVGLSEIVDRIARIKSAMVKTALVLIVTWCLLTSLFATMLFSYVSSLNYPSGYALRWLHLNQQSGHVHIDAYSAMSGITRFGYDPRFTYSKQEKNVDYSQFDYLISHEWDVPGFSSEHVEYGEPVLNITNAYRTWQLIETSPAVYVLKKNKPR